MRNRVKGWTRSRTSRLYAEAHARHRRYWNEQKKKGAVPGSSQ